MNQRALMVAVALFVVIVGGMFGYAYLKNRSMSESVPIPPPPQKEAVVPEAIHITAKHFFKDGVHTVIGEMMVPTPCDLLEANAVVRESAPEQVTIAVTVINTTGGVCAQVVTPQRFKVNFKANQGAFINATFRGIPAILNLVEAGPKETPDNFDLFEKG